MDVPLFARLEVDCRDVLPWCNGGNGVQFEFRLSKLVECHEYPHRIQSYKSYQSRL